MLATAKRTRPHVSRMVYLERGFDGQVVLVVDLTTHLQRSSQLQLGHTSSGQSLSDRSQFD
jgi:hypothetical protein